MYFALYHRSSDIRELNAEQLQYIPKIVLLQVCGDYIDHVWDRLPEHVKTDSEVQRIVKIETHTYNPFANTTFGHNDEIRIPIQQQDLYTLPYESFLYIEGKLAKTKVIPNADVALGNNCVAFMFDEIRYELNGVQIDRNRNVGVTSTLKNYVTVSSDKSVILRNAGWDPQTEADGYFNFCVPLNVLLGFCEDYRRVVINARHEFLTRSDRSCASWLIAYHHGLRWTDGTTSYSGTKRLITSAVREEEEDAVVYVKGREKRTWLRDLLLDERVHIETLDAVYEDIKSLADIDVIDTMRCGHHANNCALQNVFKIYNWWLQRNFLK
ncbi:hypothetical protein ALC62_14780 [Cyphomyrmex costatus]|uniref:Double jelly roll-like domain-containing protein n=1 Tax=Cyphomyrmex costatus TaxID=456900 RepID=A0A151I8U9_9HYME|nr:hypothetical protein ALC62_14780 [Cyphomyrmex costatus]